VEFRSKLEDLMVAEELDFEPTPGFGKYRKFLEHAVPHPAKMNTNLLEFLIKKYTREGDTILDPMAGTGSLGVVASLHGRNAIQVELEPRFYEWMEKARENVEKHPTLTPKGRIINILGDARRLSELLGTVDTVITSPPYADTCLGGGDPERRRERLIGAGYSPEDYLGGKARNTVLKHYSDVDVIVTSPPYAETISDRAGGPTGVEKVGISTTTARQYSNSGDNIGNLPLGNVDAIITSPPYASSLEGTTRHTRGGIASRDPKLAQSGTYSMIQTGELDETILRLRAFGRTDPKAGGPYGRSLAHPYSPNPDNIGNLDNDERDYVLLEKEKGLDALYARLTRNGKPTYLSEMLRVYHEMYKVLKPGGLAIVVVKPYIRNKKIIDLPYYTYLLMERVGFTLEKLYRLRLRNMSFWRILYYKKYPDIPRIAHEYVIVMKKQSSG
jgi:DNA modification methylase